jgi:hypothetical protein
VDSHPRDEKAFSGAMEANPGELGDPPGTVDVEATLEPRDSS